ncbi:diguanylate cyclase domain-containing protein [Aeromonas rivuli]|uniref:diguanylate cyclase domain-containing protein n=1 Tax=Aeromonas rivuli TaxID=648794 RepID=UPI001CCE3F41|nr:diguanylate cyclase [Aeromonas rivuli]UBO75628.1 diguanylate cyclase [Aeromonas rivuli]
MISFIRLGKKRLTLRQSLDRTHLMVSLTAVCLVGGLLTAMAMLSLRFYTDHNLDLVARAIGYTTEAAVVFQDGEAAREALQNIASHEDVAEVSIVLASGKLLAYWSRPASLPWFALERQLAELVLPGPIELPMIHNGHEVARIKLVGHGQYLLSFLVQVLAAMLVCMLLSTLGALYIARLMQRSITTPLRSLAQVAHGVSRERSLKLRVPEASITELNTLGQDFNSLLDELEAWQAHQERENASLLHLATHDNLTELPNRALFEARLQQAVNNGRARAESFSLLYLDCDNFKQINDNLGHGTGDEVLVAIARRVQHQLRPQDLVARLGGDEFVVLLSPISADRDVVDIINRIGKAMAEPIALADGSRLDCTLSIGAAHFPTDGDSAEALLQHADHAMYLAKRQDKAQRARESEVHTPKEESR